MAYYMGMGMWECPICGAAYVPQYWGDDAEACIECDYENSHSDHPSEAIRQAYNENGIYYDLVYKIKQGIHGKHHMH